MFLSPKFSILSMPLNIKYWICSKQGMPLLHGKNLHNFPWYYRYCFFLIQGIKPPYDPAIPLLGIYPQETKIEKDTCIPLFIAALFTIARTWKQPRCPPTDDWIKKLQCIHNGILLLLLLLSRFSRVRLCVTPQRAAHQAPLSLGFSRQEQWSGLPFPSPMHESEK